MAKIKCVGQAQIRLRFHFVEGITEIKVVNQRIMPAIPKVVKTMISNQIYLLPWRISNEVTKSTRRKKTEITIPGEVHGKLRANGGASKITTGAAVNGAETPFLTTMALARSFPR